VTFDWGVPDTWAPAVSGASGVFLMAPDGVEVEPGFVAHAVAAGVERIVLLSSDAVEAMGDERLLAAERVVRGSGVPSWTILRPQWFNQNFDEGFFQPAIMAGSLAMPVGDARQAFVDADDIAAVAAAALTGDGHAGRVYTVTGPRALSFAEAVAVIASAAGRAVGFRGDAESYLAQQEAIGRSREEAAGEVAAFGALARLGDATPTDDVRRVTGRAPKDFTTYAAAAATAGAWRDEEAKADD
jgi:uncharacterized protein YbjT (DUF2867 family)